ncbi:MAG: dTMP kinase [Bacilli bacterium]|jgi:dTMP kinase
MTKKKGIFITFEGCDGCGKTTVISLVSKRLEELKVPFLVTREPGGSKIAEQIRNIILDKKNTEEDPRTEALLYAASRRQHLVDVVLPALNKGELVLSDRYIDSSLAYQGYARNIGIEEVKSINDFAIDGLMPDFTFFLDLTPEEGLKRIQSRKRDSDRLDAEKLAFHKRVYEGYQIIIKNDPKRFIMIDARQTPEEETEEIVSAILKAIK